MSTPTERLAAVQKNYIGALTHESQDLAAAATAAEVTDILNNVLSARQTYYSAVAEALAANGAGVEAAYNDALAAQAAIQAVRNAPTNIANLITALTNGTNKATDLMKKAKL